MVKHTKKIRWLTAALTSNVSSVNYWIVRVIFTLNFEMKDEELICSCEPSH